MQIAPDIYCVPGVIANVFVLVDPDGLTLVDAGLPYSQRRILAYVAALGYPPEAVRRLLVTHADRDHIGSLAALQARTGARVFAGALEAAALQAGRETRRLQVGLAYRGLLWLLGRLLFVRVQPASVDEHLADGQELPVLGGLRVLATPGHTPGHLSFYAVRSGVLFAGDSLRTLGGRLRVSSGPNTADEALARASAERQLALRPRLICTGHGPAVVP